MGDDDDMTHIGRCRRHNTRFDMADGQSCDKCDDEPVVKTHTIATWSISLDCVCPACGEKADLLTDVCFWDSGIKALEYDTEKSIGLEVVCLGCETEFAVDLKYE